MNPTAPSLIRWSGFAAVAAGVIFAGIQPIHPPDELSSVGTGGWAIITMLKYVMCFLFLIGLTGIYARQVSESGWLGLLGYLMFGLSWAVQSSFVFIEAFVLPLLSGAAPRFLESYLGVVNGDAGEMNIRPLPQIYALLVGITYTFGGGLFGIATLPRICPAAATRRFTRHRRSVDAVGCAPPARDPTAGGGADGDRCGVSRIRTVVRKTKGSDRTPVWLGLPACATTCRSLGVDRDRQG